MAEEAWTGVTPETIRNCFRKAGFKTPDSATTQGDVVVEPPSGIDAEQFERFVEVDHDLECVGDPTDEDICSDVSKARTDIHDDETQEADSPTTAQVQRALDTLRDWMQVHGEHAEYSRLSATEGIIQSRLINQRKQMKITNFFRQDPQL